MDKKRRTMLTAGKQGITALFFQIVKLNIIKESKAYSARFRTGGVRPFVFLGRYFFNKKLTVRLV